MKSLNFKNNNMKNEKKWRVIQGNCLDTLKSMESNSIDSIVTDPPY